MMRIALSAFVLMATPASADEISAQTTAAMHLIRDGRTPEGLNALDALISAGDSSAIEGLAELLLWGAPGIPRDAVRACDLFERGRELGRGDSAHSFASCYYNGDGRAQDYARAAEIYQEAIARGFSMSRCALGNMYVLGRGVAADPARGMAMCLESANAGDVDAMTDVAEHLLRGEGVERDPVAAHAWLERAAAGGQRNAPYWLGAIYWNGDGVARDTTVAARWWRIAFERGRMDAASRLGDEAYIRFAEAARHPGRLGDRSRRKRWAGTRSPWSGEAMRIASTQTKCLK
ncbi:MAG: sel1 repeat family protein [Hyphomonadaceae bacterium JAD_PAG50586_4]|nr:MAG: sel1 repeat family protein [Hyphomonadaceae bacterium JAD_PAG50586_4]